MHSMAFPYDKNAGQAERALTCMALMTAAPHALSAALDVRYAPILGRNAANAEFGWEICMNKSLIQLMILHLSLVELCMQLFNDFGWAMHLLTILYHRSSDPTREDMLITVFLSLLANSGRRALVML